MQHMALVQTTLLLRLVLESPVQSSFLPPGTWTDTKNSPPKSQYNTSKNQTGLLQEHKKLVLTSLVVRN
jgi:hypothetical protein